MAIVKNSFRVSRMDADFSPATVLSEDVESSASLVSSIGGGSGSGSDADSGMGSDEIDLSEFGEPGMEFCQVGNQSCSIPLELYDLDDLGGVLSLETWNDCLTEEERFSLAAYLPDMDQDGFALNLKELFCGTNFHFGNPLIDFLNMLSGGFCDPRVVLYRQGLNLFQRRQYYHRLRKYQNSMVGNLVRMKDVWLKCNGYGVEERLLALKYSRRKNADSSSETNSEKDDSSEAARKTKSKRLSYNHSSKKPSQKSNINACSRSSRKDMKKPLRLGKEKSKGVLKVSVLKEGKNSKSNYSSQFSNGTEKNSNGVLSRNDPHSAFASLNGSLQGSWNSAGKTTAARSSLTKSKSKIDSIPKKHSGLQNHINGGRSSDQEAAIVSNGVKKPKLSAKNSKYRSPIHPPKVYNDVIMSDNRNSKDKKQKHGDYHHRSGIDLLADSYEALPTDQSFFHSEYNTKVSRAKQSDKFHSKDSKSGHFYAQSEETHSDSSDQVEEDDGSYPYAKRSEFRITDPRKSNKRGRHEDELYCKKVKLKGKSSRRHQSGHASEDRTEDDLDVNLPFQDALEKNHLRSSAVLPMDCDSLVNKQTEDLATTKKKGKRKAEDLPIETMVPEKGDLELDHEAKTQRKVFIPITPTIHTGFSFSVIHLLSAVRKALVSPHMYDSGDLELAGKTSSLPSLTILEIVDRVRLNPGDPCILETLEPLQDLIRGALKIFLSRTAPLGAKNWKSLVLYDKSSKTWAWIGALSDNETTEETSAENWNIPHKMLVKLVDAFANWLKSGQETLRQIGSLPAPPVVPPVLDEKERFRDLRAQKSLSTIRPSSDELRSYFRKEELLRYSIPDRAFQYTAFDGRKSIVAPLRRGGGKPTSKARDHFMLRPDRPPHVTVLCLVRDAASRLPGSVGTRADVCTLIRDSQFIVEDVSDAQINQVVSGALDRLHYERDPCVQFDGDRKLWVYLHRDREDEDFEDDGTSSTKKWKRQRKDVADASDLAAANDLSCLAAGDMAAVSSPGYEFNPDMNAADSSAGGELLYSDLRPTKENFQSFVSAAPPERRRDDHGSWEANCLPENRMLCRENSANDDFDDELFCRNRAAGFLSGSLL